MEQARYILRFLILLISHPQQLWEYLTTDGVEESKPDYVQRKYFFPLLGFMALVIFLCEGFHHASPDTAFDLQFGMTKMVPCLVAFLVGPYLAMMLLKELLVRFYKMSHPNSARIHLFVLYSTSFLMALEMLLAFIPSIRFFSFIVVYLIYITWTGSTSIIRIQEHHRWVFGFLSAVIIYFSSHLLITIIEHMQG